MRLPKKRKRERRHQHTRWQKRQRRCCTAETLAIPEEQVNTDKHLEHVHVPRTPMAVCKLWIEKRGHHSKIIHTNFENKSELRGAATREISTAPEFCVNWRMFEGHKCFPPGPLITLTPQRVRFTKKKTHSCQHKSTSDSFWNNQIRNFFVW